jgi:hypothetical protein
VLALLLREGKFGARPRLRLTDLEEVQVAPELRARRAVVLGAHLPEHDDDDADQRREREEHRREDTREASDFAHGCGCSSWILQVNTPSRL